MAAAGDEILVELDGARVLFTTRRGGVSEGPYESLNFGFLTDDDPLAVKRNRELVSERHGVELIYGRQVHGAVVNAAKLPTPAPIERDGELDLAGWREQLIDCDGWATTVEGLAPMVLAADCLPIALTAPGAVAMVHAGWQGLASGVIAAGVAVLRELGASGPLQAAIGPAAGVCCYEVSDELHDRFGALGQDFHAGRNLDLKAIARHQLRAAGATRIEEVGLCTICAEPGLLYSHRRDHGVTGRQAGIAWLS